MSYSEQTTDNESTTITTTVCSNAKCFAIAEPTMLFFQIHSPDGTILQSDERHKQRKSGTN